MKRILVVDDDHELLSLLAFALRRRGYLVELATNGGDALEHVRRGQFDVVLLDWNMPAMDGAALLRQCCREAGTSVPPVVVMSRAPETAPHALHLGAVAVVERPFRFADLEALLVSLTRALGGQGGYECRDVFEGRSRVSGIPTKGHLRVPRLVRTDRVGSGTLDQEACRTAPSIHEPSPDTLSLVMRPSREPAHWEVAWPQGAWLKVERPTAPGCAGHTFDGYGVPARDAITRSQILASRPGSAARASEREARVPSRDRVARKWRAHP
jgi:DNA-binding response OmpR family regulator